MRLAEGMAFDEPLMEANGSNYDLKARFAYWNKKLFNDKLPEVPIKWCRSRSHSGICKSDIRNGVFENHSIEISNLYDREESGYDQIMIHEMIHLFNHVEYPTVREYRRYFDKGGHGAHFEQKAKEMSEKSGLKISVRDDLEGATAPTKGSKLGVIIIYDKDAKLPTFRLISFPSKYFTSDDKKSVDFRSNLARMFARYSILDMKLGYSDAFVFSNYKVLTLTKSYIVDALSAKNYNEIYKALGEIPNFDPEKIKEHQFKDEFIFRGYKVPN